ncbi:hypothetical protein EUGRSUZ_B03650 [Eucalyptus grandis]|uniref:Receptor-like serine/threonine-protein kinase n=2 Tax=Eucalyptus grandis TaxID=71139 RepID=A0A059D957_EUCGR|nr:hypothetical protein EUGRSUZ_B03650 [Eucalyptus grandis]
MAYSVVLAILLLLPFPLSTKAQTYGNQTSGSSLTTNDQNSWLSPSGEFAFGFQKIGTTEYLLAVWFDKIDEKTIIWSANGDNLAAEGSKVQLSADGRLVLTDPKGEELWAPSPTVSGVTYAAMLDTGNFILANQDHANLWETFSQPTDTILPTQMLNQGIVVNARYSATNYSTGRFHFILQADGDLVFYPTPTPLASSDAYWSSNTKGSGFQWYSIKVARSASQQGMERYLISSPQAQSQPADFTKEQSLNMTVSSGNMSTQSQQIQALAGHWALPFNVYRFTRFGLSYCTLGDDQRPRCQCPPGYTLLDPTNDMNGCKQDFVPPSCEGGNPETDLFSIRDMLNTDWPLSDYEYNQPQTEDWCRQDCLADCFCAVAIFRNGNCWKKRIPLSNGQMDLSVGGKALIKVRIDNSTSKFPGDGQKKHKNSTLIIIGSVLLSSSVCVNLLLLLITYLLCGSFRHRDVKWIRPFQINQVKGMQSFTYQELKEATDGFKEELGRGAFGAVYKGVLGSNDTNFFAVKVLEKKTGDAENEFEREVSAIGQTNHKNLVQLLGFCNEGQHRLLVYEFMSNGTLADFLFSASRPSWYKRIEIACGVARGLAYLHDDCTRQIIHCDIKPQNILLDDSLSPKISDFGLAKLLMADQTRTTTGVRGTRGYLAPEWFRNMPISGKVDIYSFGIVLLELICCRKHYELEVENEAQRVLVDWVYDCYAEGKVHLLVESDEEAMSDKKRVERFVMTAMWCIQEDPAFRPSMKKITQMLEGAVEVSVPPDPDSFISSI